METQTIVILVAVAAVIYLIGKNHGKKAGKRDLFNSICDRRKSWVGELTDESGQTFEVKTKYLGQEIAIQQEVPSRF